jgi:hypothetical protein
LEAAVALVLELVVAAAEVEVFFIGTLCHLLVEHMLLV